MRRIALLLVVVMCVLASLPASAADPNRLRNAGFELDANADNEPDRWLVHGPAEFVTSTDYFASGQASGKIIGMNGESIHIHQRVGNLVAGQTYELAGSFFYEHTDDLLGVVNYQVVWFGPGVKKLGVDTVWTRNHSNVGFIPVSERVTAPANATWAVIKVQLVGLFGNVYVDDTYFGKPRP